MWRPPPPTMLATLLAHLAANPPRGTLPADVQEWGARMKRPLLASLAVAHEHMGWPAWAWADPPKNFGTTMMLSPWTSGPEAGAKRRYWMAPMAELPAWDDPLAWVACSVESVDNEDGMALTWAWTAQRPGAHTEGSTPRWADAMPDCDAALLALVGLPHNRRTWPGWMLGWPGTRMEPLVKYPGLGLGGATIPLYVSPWSGTDGQAAYSSYVPWCDRVRRLDEPGAKDTLFVGLDDPTHAKPFAWFVYTPAEGGGRHGRAATWPEALAEASRDLAYLNDEATPLVPVTAPLPPIQPAPPAGAWKIGDPYGWVLEVFAAAERELGVRLVVPALGSGVNGQVFAVDGDPARVVKITSSAEEVAGMLVLREWDAGVIPRISRIVELGKHSRPPDYPTDPRLAWAILREAVVPATDEEARAAYDTWSGPSVPRKAVKPYLRDGIKLVNYDRTPGPRGWMPANEADVPRRGQPFLRAINMAAGVGYHRRNGTPAQAEAAYYEYLGWLYLCEEYATGANQKQRRGVPHIRALRFRSDPQGNGTIPPGVFLDWHPGNVGRTLDGRTVYFDIGWYPLLGKRLDVSSMLAATRWDAVTAPSSSPAATRDPHVTPAPGDAFTSSRESFKVETAEVLGVLRTTIRVRVTEQDERHWVRPAPPYEAELPTEEFLADVRGASISARGAD